MTFLQTDKMKLSVLVVTFLLLVSAFTFLPAVGAFSPTTVAKTGAAPATVVGATATIDSSVIAGVPNTGTLGVLAVRTITVSNPTGNPAITSLTISIPKGAATTSTTTVAFNTGGSPPAGAYPANSGVPTSPAPTVATFGSGPWAIVFTAGSGSVLVPGGASITLQISFNSEAATTTTGVADSYSLSVSATDSTTATTTLSSITIFETASTSVTVTGPSGSAIAGTPFTIKASTTDTGVPLVVSAVGSSTQDLTGKTTTLSPSSFTTSSSPTSISVNDTTAETTLTLTVNGGKLASDSDGTAALTGSVAVQVYAGAVTSLAVAIIVGGTTYSPTNPLAHGLNETSLAPIAGGASASNEIVISTADKYLNPAPFSTTQPTQVTLTSVTLSGQPTGFSIGTGYNTGGAYPYTPTATQGSEGVLPSLIVSIPATLSSVTLNSTTNFFYGVDYGSQSYILASTSTSGLASSKSVTITTYTVNSNHLTITDSASGSVKAGQTDTLTATISGIQQANVPVNFKNTSDYSPATVIGAFSNGGMAINTTTSVVSGVEQAVVTFTPATLLGASVTIVGRDALPGATGAFAYNTATGSVTIGTTGGSVAKLVVVTAFDSAFAYNTTKTTSSGKLYVDVETTDAYGNPATVSAATQVSLTSTGALSATLLEIPSSGSSTLTGPTGFQYSVFVPSTGSSFTISASAVVGSSILSGTTTVTVVSATPSLALTAPSTITTGVPSTVNGTAVVSSGVGTSNGYGYIKGVQYSLNGAGNITVVNGTSSTTASKLTFQFSLLLTGANSVVVWAEDSSGHWVSSAVSIPIVPAAQTFTNSTDLKQITFTAGPNAVQASYTNNGATSLTVIIVANVLNAQGAIILESTATVTIAAGATGTGYPVIQGIAHGTYTVQVTVYSTSYVTLSPTTSLSVTV